MFVFHNYVHIHKIYIYIYFFFRKIFYMHMTLKSVNIKKMLHIYIDIYITMKVYAQLDGHITNLNLYLCISTRLCDI